MKQFIEILSRQSLYVAIGFGIAAIIFGLLRICLTYLGIYPTIAIVVIFYILGWTWWEYKKRNTWTPKEENNEEE